MKLQNWSPYFSLWLIYSFSKIMYRLLISFLWCSKHSFCSKRKTCPFWSCQKFHKSRGRIAYTRICKSFPCTILNEEFLKWQSKFQDCEQLFHSKFFNLEIQVRLKRHKRSCIWNRSSLQQRMLQLNLKVSLKLSYNL